MSALERLGAKEVQMSATGLREGYLYSLLDDETCNSDALLEATGELAILRSRSPQHGLELADWTGAALKSWVKRKRSVKNGGAKLLVI